MLTPVRRVSLALVSSLLVLYSGSAIAASGPGLSRPRSVIVLEGRVELTIEDRFSDKSSTSYFVLRSDDGETYRLNPSDLLGAAVPRGKRFRLTLRESGGFFEVLHADPLPSGLRPQAIELIGNRKVLVIPYRFSDAGSYPFSTSDLRTAMDNTRSHLDKLSYGLSLTTSNDGTTSGDINSVVTGSYARPTTEATCNLGTITGDAISKAHDYTTANYQHFIVVTSNAGCSFEGLTTVGGSQIWINASTSTTAWAHELAHNYGLYHSKQCLSPGTTGVFCAGSSSPEYGDADDLMSTGLRHLNASNKSFLGWFLTGHLTSITSSKVLTLYAYEEPTVSPNAAQFSSYFLEYRQAINGDELIDTNPTTGVTIHGGGGGSTSYLYNAGWATDSTFNHRALVPPDSASDPQGTFKITSLEKGGSGSTAWIRVRFDLMSTDANAPTALNAHQTSQTQIALSWTAPANGANGYEISRAGFAGGSVPGIPTYTAVGSTNGATTFTDTTSGGTPLQTGYSYLYRVRACRPCTPTATWYGYSDVDPATLFSDYSLAANGAVRAVHIQEVRTATDLARSLVQLSTGSWSTTVSAGSRVYGLEWDEVRSRVSEAFGPPYGGYTDASPLATKAIRAVHVTEIRSRLQ